MRKCLSLIISALILSMCSTNIANASILEQNISQEEITNINTRMVEMGSGTGSSSSKELVYYLSKSQVKEVYKAMKNAQTTGLWAGIFTSFIPGANATVAGIGIALSSNAAGRQEVEKAYHNGMRLKITQKYGISMSLNTVTFKAVN